MENHYNYTVNSKCSDSDHTQESEASTNAKEIAVTIEDIDNIDHCKVKEIMLKIEFAGELVAQTEQILIKKGLNDVGLTGFINVEEMDYSLMDEILANPVLFKIYDCTEAPQLAAQLPKTDKEAKNKTSKASKNSTSPTSGSKLTVSTHNILGIANLDIGPLLMGKRQVKETLLVEVEKKLPPQEMIPWVKLPKIRVAASTGNEFLIPPSANKMNNVIGVTIESVYNIPDYITEGAVFDASIPIPKFGNKNNNLVFPNGTITELKEPDSRKKWLTLSHIEGNGKKSKNLVEPTVHDITNTLPGQVNLEKEIKKLRPEIQWNFWRNCLLIKSDSNYIFSKLMKYRVWPVEVYMSNKSNPPKTAKSDKKSKPVASAVPPTSSDHFTAFLNISSLLYPGVKKARVAAQLYTYSRTDLISKFGAEFTPSRSQSSVTIAKSKTASEKSKFSIKEPENVSETPGTPVYNDEGAPTFIVVEIELLKPFTAKRDPEYLEDQLKHYLSLKGKVSSKLMNVVVAKENYLNSIKRAVSVLSQEYHKFLSCKKYKKESENFDIEFHEFLSQRETFCRVKSSLENNILDLINEKYGALSDYKSRIPEIYIYLIEEMHKVTNSYMRQNDISKSYFNTNDLQLFAEECYEERDFDAAREYLLLKLTKQPSNPDNWLDYAVFCNRMGEYEVAIEAAREALILDANHQMGLLIYGLLMAKTNNESVAELAFQVLLSKFPEFMEGWDVLRIFYLTLNNFEGVDVTFKMAAKLEYEIKADEKRRATRVHTEDFICPTYFLESTHSLTGEGKWGISSYQKGKTSAEPLCWTTTLCPPDNMNIRTAVLLIRLGFHEYGSMALSEVMLMDDGGVSPFYLYYLAVSFYVKGDYPDCISKLEALVKRYGKDCYAWALMGHCYYKLESDVNAVSCYEYVMESYNRPDDIHLIYLRMGYYYLKAKKYSCAKQILITACKYSPTPKLWKGVGIACLRLKEFENADIAFSEANYLDNRDAETWGYLALTNALMHKLQLFQHCYLEAKKRNLTNQSLINELDCCLTLNNLDIEGS